ncbi:MULTISPECIES: ABC transporter permease [unclassified Methanoregula]|uniref:ABC transporter permease n=1 Tax=unclassified Methanoregula TaxID=2649730 RepID=UPI0009D08275|nr:MULTISPECIES: ABC transporter permease [unclassified Methanoregula]OPX62017.1 MAG: ABC-2 family transporter protein [Methanoregula sp. PtaB.Bin085]OPY34308.1 MAG: ABC-2 family transporter protein [Methanoregula sp. PtaU1.Bin006]
MIKGAFAIFMRDFKKFLSNPFVIIITMFMPIMYLIIFGNAMGGTITHIPIAVVQEEPSVSDTPLFTSAVGILRTQAQRDYPRTFDLTVYTDELKAKRDLKAGIIKGVVIFPSTVSGNRPVRLYVDSSDYMTPTIIQAGVQSAMLAGGAHNPVMVNKIYGDIRYIQFFGVGVIVMAIFMSTMMGGGIALIKDREMGIIEGYLVTPVKRSSIILGMIGSGTIRAFFAGFILFIVDILVTGIVIQSTEDFLLILFVLFIASLGVTSLMVSVASRFSNQQEYASVTAFFSLILFMTSGAFYPTAGMPDWLRWITVINPEYYTVDALRSIILRGQGLDVIGMDLVALLLFSTITILIGISTYRRTLD